jgi:hypothetical protein
LKRLRRRAAVCLLLAPGTAGALAAVGATAAEAGDELRLVARETRALLRPGVSAAFSLDASVVEASMRAGRLVLVARHAGETLVSLVLDQSIETLRVRVEAPSSQVALPATGAGREHGTAEIRYDSGTQRYGLGATLQAARGPRAARAQVQAVHDASGRARSWSLPAARIELSDGERRAVLLDDFVQDSPLTLDGVLLRGVHLENGRTSVHAGTASAQPWDDLLLPRQGDRAVAVSHRLERDGVDFVPRALWLPDSDTKVPGVLALGAQQGNLDTPLQWAAELGWSDRPGLSFEAALRQPQRSAWVQGAWRPQGFAALDVARPAGAWLDGAWTERLGDATQATAALSANRLDLEARHPQSLSARIDVEHRMDQRWTLESGVGGSSYRDGETRAERANASLGVRVQGRGLQAAAQYRYQHDAVQGEGGHGGRLSLQAARGGLRAQAFVDAQQHAPTLDLLLPAGSPLARVFAELGLRAETPGDVLRLLHEHAADFTAHGVQLGELQHTPLRVQAGAEASWRGDGPLQAGVRWLQEERRGGGEARESRLAMLFAIWRVARRTELEVGYSRWSAAGIEDAAWQVALRTAFSGLPLPGLRSSIEGRVLQDGGAPLAEVELVLDGNRRTRSDGEGRFAFDRAGPGTHRLEARLAPGAAAYFRGASSVNVAAGDKIGFEIIAAPARIAGHVRNDAGLGLAGVTVQLEGGVEASTVTDSSGAFEFAAPPGRMRVRVVPESVPAGHDLADLEERTLTARVEAAAAADFVLRAQRSVQGRVPGAPAGTIVAAPALGRSVPTDADGRFVLRGLPAGPLTLRANGASVVVDVPAQPGRVADIELPAP